jgi:hypothetical protein
MINSNDWKNFGYDSNEPCDICGNSDTKLEPRFGYATCREHADIPPVERIDFQQREQKESYVILSKTQPEIVDFTYYTDEEVVSKRVADLNKLAKREEYWYITLFPSHRNSEKDGKMGTKKFGENLVPELWEFGKSRKK